MANKEGIKTKYREAFYAALDEVVQNGFNSLWDDNQMISRASVIITLEPGVIVKIKYKKEVYSKPPKFIPKESCDNNE